MRLGFYKSIILYFSITVSFSFNNEISGKFIYDTDLSKNELYLLNERLELQTYDLETGILKYSSKIISENSQLKKNKTWSGLYAGDVNLSRTVLTGLMDNLILKKIENNKFYLFHDGGGLVLSIENFKLTRVDNSFPFMNKFFGDFILKNDKIYHFGGYGLFRSNNAMLLFDGGNSNQWNEVNYKNNLPSEIKGGLASFFSLLIDSDYYILGGNSSFNTERIFNKSILKFDFNDFSWTKLGNINLDLSDESLILGSGNWFYVFGEKFFHFIDIEKSSIYKYKYKLGFSPADLGSLESFISYNNTFENINTLDISDVTLNIFKNHNSKSETVILSKYKLGNMIDIDSISELPLLKYEQSRNQFFIPMLIVLMIIIINLLHKGMSKGIKKINNKLFNFEEDELFFLNTKISIDNNTVEIIKMLIEKEKITSYDVVSKLVDNGLSYDYASKVKNKIIESLNEKFIFVTGSKEPFIKVSKSSQDKRIQILSLISS